MPIPTPHRKPNKSDYALEFRRSRSGTGPLGLTLPWERVRLWPLTNDVPFVDMAAHQAPLAQKITGHAARRSRRYIGMNMVGDLGRYAQFEAAQAIPIWAANDGGGAGGRHQHGADHDERYEAGRATGRRAGRIGRDEVLRGMRTRHSEDRQVLCGVRQGSAMMGRR